jgi:hypothetical protein
VVRGLRLRDSRWSAIRRLKIVWSQLRNSPIDLPSKADAMALATASPATFSASAEGSFSRARFTRLSQ